MAPAQRRPARARVRAVALSGSRCPEWSCPRLAAPHSGAGSATGSGSAAGSRLRDLGRLDRLARALIRLGRRRLGGSVWTPGSGIGASASCGGSGGGGGAGGSAVEVGPPTRASPYCVPPGAADRPVGAWFSSWIVEVGRWVGVVFTSGNVPPDPVSVFCSGAAFRRADRRSGAHRCWMSSRRATTRRQARRLRSRAVAKKQS